MKNCWEIKGCPASFYLECPAYKRRISCWEINEGCLCRVNPTCDTCTIFIDHEEEIAEKSRK